jgi:UDP-glucose 4-epimerase
MDSSLTPYKNARVLVTGGMGFIGSNLALALWQASAEVFVIDSEEAICGANSRNLFPGRDQIKVEKIDLADFALLSKAQAFVKPLDFVFTLAGSVAHLPSAESPDDDLRCNALATLNTLRLVHRKSPNARVVHTGTRQVYGRARYLPVDENHPLQPPDVNGVHKLAAENYHGFFHRSEGLRTTVLRLPNIYGPRQMVRSPGLGFAGTVIGRAMRGETVTLFGGGHDRRDFLYVADVVEALLLAGVTKACVGQTYNLSAEPEALSEFVEQLGLAAGKLQIDHRDLPANLRKIAIGDLVCDSSRFRAATGWEARTNLAEGLKATVDFLRGVPEHYL